MGLLCLELCLASSNSDNVSISWTLVHKNVFNDTYSSLYSPQCFYLSKQFDQVIYLLSFSFSAAIFWCFRVDSRTVHVKNQPAQNRLGVRKCVVLYWPGLMRTRSATISREIHIDSSLKHPKEREVISVPQGVFYFPLPVLQWNICTAC